MTLRIASTGGATYQTILDDPLASTFCKTTAATVTGTGTLSGNRLVSTGNLVCADGRRLDSAVTVVFTYHPENDTITDDGTGSPFWARSS
jgi:hypothetical protein